MKSTWLDELYECLSEDPFRKKLLLTARYDQGEQWLNRLCRDYGPLMNVEVETIRTLAVKYTKRKLDAEGMTFISRDQVYWLIHGLMLELAESFPDFLPADQVTPGLVRSFHSAIGELREAGKQAGDLELQVFDSRPKGLYIKQLLAGYERRLAEQRLVDYAGLTAYLPEQVGERSTLVMIPPQLVTSTYEHEMLGKLFDSRQLYYFEDKKSFPESLLEHKGNRVEIFHAAGSTAEVREVLRRICAGAISLDEAEVILSDYKEYSTIVHTQVEALGIPCTFSQGLPVIFYNMGKAAFAYLDWLESNYEIECLFKGFRHRYLAFRTGPAAGDRISGSVVVRLLERCGIGWGRERYRLFEVAAGNEQDEEARKLWSQLSEGFQSLYAGLPVEGAWTPAGVLQGLVQFLEKCGVTRNEADALMLDELRTLGAEMALVQQTPVSRETAIRYVRERLDQLHSAGQGPKSGHLHVSSLQDGGESGRAHTFITGMKDSSWSLHVQQDPVLLDEERLNLGSLKLSSEQAAWTLTERHKRMGAIHGSVTLSFSAYEPLEQKESHPAYDFLLAARRLSRDPAMDYSSLARYLGEPVLYAPTGSAGSQAFHLDGTDRWIERLAGQGALADGSRVVRRSLAFAEQAHEGAVVRQQPSLSGYDGLLEEESFNAAFRGAEASHVSVTQLERYAECPRRFFYQSVLRIKPKESPVFERSAWLNPAERGSLLHQVFDRYLRETVAQNPVGEPMHDWQRLSLLTETVIREFADKVPPPSPHILGKESEAIRRDIRVFYQMETERMTRPRYFELDLTIGGEPMTVDLGEGLTIRLKGFIDRVDEIRPHEYKIIDYKTGNPKKYSEGAYFARGTQLQHSLYAAALEQWMRITGTDLEAKVVESAYCFPTERGKGEEAVRLQNRRDDLRKVLGALLDSLENGIFITTNDPVRSHCNSCDYQNVCGGEAELMQSKWEQVADDPKLKAIREVWAVD
ncbi:ATP-dependent helicase/deoxyribonuclease subunit B [compost metagenome]